MKSEEKMEVSTLVGGASVDGWEFDVIVERAANGASGREAGGSVSTF
jgi:hypothetical protein